MHSMPKKPKPAAEQMMRAKALDRRKRRKRIRPNKELLAKYMNRPPTLETLFEVIKEGQQNPENSKARRIYLLRHLTSTPAERKLAMKALVDYNSTKSTFARALLESRARKQGRPEAKKQLLKEIEALIEKIKSKSRKLLNVAQTLEAMSKEPIKAELVRHNGHNLINLYLSALMTLEKEIEKL